MQTGDDGVVVLLLAPPRNFWLGNLGPISLQSAALRTLPLGQPARAQLLHIMPTIIHSMQCRPTHWTGTAWDAPLLENCLHCIRFAGSGAGAGFDASRALHHML